MGTHVEGTASVSYSRKLTEEEYDSWREAIGKGHPTPGTCQHPAHEDAALVEVEPGTYRCANFGKPEASHGYCFDDDNRYKPGNWTLDGFGGGDIGVLDAGNGGFEVYAGGKVYDLLDAIAFFVGVLPEGVTAEGGGSFTADMEHFGIAVRGREVKEVESFVWTEGDPAPAGSVVWVLGHVSFTDGTIALRLFSDEGEARAHYLDERVEHDEGDDVLGIREDAPWLAHFTAGDGECLTWLDTEEVR